MNFVTVCFVRYSPSSPAAGVAVAVAPAADAAQGCGRGFHRTPHGRCVPNWHGRETVVIGNFYPGRGYWDGRRYWWHRTRWHGGWRYR